MSAANNTSGEISASFLPRIKTQFDFTRRIRHRIDLLLTLEAECEAHLQFHPLFGDELSFVVSPAHAWAGSGRVDRADTPRQIGEICNGPVSA